MQLYPTVVMLLALLLPVSALAVDLSTFAPPNRRFTFVATPATFPADGVTSSVVSLSDPQGVPWGSPVTIIINGKTVAGVTFPQTVTASAPGTWDVSVVPPANSGVVANSIHLEAVPTPAPT